MRFRTLLLGSGFLVAVLALSLVAMTTYTNPIAESSGFSAVRKLITGVLARDTGLAEVASAEAQATTFAAAKVDSSGLGAWTGSGPMLRWITRELDTLHLSAWRLSLHHGCPLVSSLHATVTHNDKGDAVVNAIRWTCPGADHSVRDT